MPIDQSLEDFLDGEGLDNPLANHRLSADAYIAWGRSRSEAVLVYKTSKMEFGGRNATISAIFENVCSSIIMPPEKNRIYFIHASPGVGKTRLFLEMVKFETDKQIRHLLGSDDQEEARAIIGDILYIAASFNGSTQYDSADSTITGKTECLSHIIIRILYIWLTDAVDITKLSKTMETALKSGKLPPQEFTLSSVLSLVAQRAKKKNVVLLIDEILKVTDSDIKNDLVLRLASEQDKRGSYTLRVLFSALKVDIFARARTNSGRQIVSIPLPLLGGNDTESLASKAADNVTDVYLRGRSLGTKRQLVRIMALLSGGHMRAMEHLSKTLGQLRNSQSVLYYISQACISYRLDFPTNIYGAVLLSLLGSSVPVNSMVRRKDTSVTVEDMVANGQLMASLTHAETDLRVLPNMPLISLIQWAFFVNDECPENGTEEPGREIAKLVTKLVDTAVTSGPITGKIFESVCIIRHLTMRHVYKSLMEDNIIDNPTKVDWRRATLRDYFRYIRREGPISADLANLTFDFTKTLTWERLDNNDKIREFLTLNYAEKRSVIGQPLKINFEAIDYFIGLVSNCGVVVTIAVQTRFSSETSGSKINVGDIEKILQRAKNITVEYGVPENTIICVAELWREGPSTGEINEPMKLENAFMQTKSELENQVGPLMINLISLGDLKNIYG